MMNNDLISFYWYLIYILCKIHYNISTNNPDFIMSKFITHKLIFHTLYSGKWMIHEISTLWVMNFDIMKSGLCADIF